VSPERAELLERRAKDLATRPSLTRVPVAGGRLATVVNPEPFAPAKEIPRDSVEALEAYGVEIELDAKELEGGPVVLVPRLTGRKDRREITFKDAATLRLLVDSFPGARVTAIRTAREVADDAGKERQS
jgi:hypothetical protein